MSLTKSKLKFFSTMLMPALILSKCEKWNVLQFTLKKKFSNIFSKIIWMALPPRRYVCDVKINELEGHRVIKTQSWVWQRANWNFSARCWCQRLFCQNVKNEMSSNLHWKKSFRIFFRKLFGWLCRLADMFGPQNQWIRRS